MGIGEGHNSKKQRKEYRKKDSQPKLVEGPIDKLKTNASSGVNAGSLLGHYAFDKIDEGADDFADMPPLEDALDHDRSSPRQGLFTPTLDISEQGMVKNSHALCKPRAHSCSTFNYDSY